VYLNYRTIGTLVLAVLFESAILVQLRGQEPKPFPPATNSFSGAALALTGAKIYPSPSATPIPIGTVVISDGKILAVGPQQKVKIPENAKVIDCSGLVITAGFQNSHVHFMEPKWNNSMSLPAARLAKQLDESLRSTVSRPL
jgi:predicted amidohydrolase YtcJ